MAMQFKKAQRTLSRLRLAVSGPSGSGKTYGALKLAKGLGGKIAVIDTERGSASLYAGLPDMPEFDVLELDSPFTPERYIQAIEAAKGAGYDVLIIDSMSHEWSGPGGCLELNESIANSKYRSNTWSAWSETTPRHRKFVDTILATPMHVICTMRSKTDTVMNDSNGKKVLKKIGMKAEQRDGIDYEFTIVFDVTVDHLATVSKDRTAMFTDPVRLDESVGKQIADWLAGAHEHEPEPDPIDEAALLAHAKAVASGGTKAFRAEWRSLSDEQKDALKPHVEELKAIASESDAAFEEASATAPREQPSS